MMGRIDEQAAEWAARMDSESWSTADEAALQEWLSGDYRRRGALLQAQAVWASLDGIGNGYSSAASLGSGPGRHGALRVSRRHLVLTTVGAAAASVAGGFLWFGLLRSTYSTELGEIRKIPLADGSTATLNSGSKIDVHLAKQRREVRLDSGEAWFQVAKDPARPFVVTAGAVVVQAVGTAFSVRRREQGSEVLVTEGVVEGWTQQADGHRIRLTAGEHAFIGDNSAIHLVNDGAADVNRTLAWRGGDIDLQGRSLQDAIAEFNRYNHRKLVLDDPALAGEQFDGIFRTDDPEGFAIAVQKSFGTSLDLQSQDVIHIGKVRR